MAGPNESKKSQMSEVLSKLIETLSAQCLEAAEARKAGSQAKWVMPSKDDSDWQGDLFDFASIVSAFDSSEPNQQFLDAIKDKDSPGVVGDLINCQVSLEYLAVLERAFRQRHTQSFSRSVLHGGARKYGLGRDTGVFKWVILKYLQDVQKMSSVT
jgi:hypothetical protein